MISIHNHVFITSIIAWSGKKVHTIEIEVNQINKVNIKLARQT